MENVFTLLKESYSEWSRHEAPRLGAALAYYTVLSMAPLLIVVIAVIGLAFGREAAQGQIMQQIQGMVGKTGAEAIQTVVANSAKPSSGIVATIIGLITLFLGASGVFVELRDSLNRIWEVPKRAEEGIWTMIRTRFLSFGMVVAIGFVLLVSLVVSAGIAAAGTFMSGLLPVPAWVLEGVNLVFSMLVFTGVFAAIYRVLPDEPITWRDTVLGAAFTSVLFTVGKSLIGFYLGHASVASAYGAAGSLVVVLVWVYYSAQIFFFGAEFTHVFSLRHGSHSPSMLSTAVVTVPAHITGDPETAGRDADDTKEEVAAGGAGMKPGDKRKPSMWLVAAVGGLAWWRGRSRAGVARGR